MACEKLLPEIEAWYQHYDECNVVITADFSIDLDSADNITLCRTLFS